MVEYMVLRILGIGQAFKIYDPLKFLHGSQWENRKMCNILETAHDRTVKSVLAVLTNA